MHRVWHHHIGITHGIAGVGCACGWQDPAWGGEAAEEGLPMLWVSVSPTGFFFEPTVFTDVEDHMFIAKEESFGPVMVISRFADG